MTSTQEQLHLEAIRLAQQAQGDQLQATGRDVLHMKDDLAAVKRDIAKLKTQDDHPWETLLGRLAVVGFLATMAFGALGLLGVDVRFWDGPSASERAAQKSARVFLGRDLEPGGLQFWAPRYERDGISGLVEMTGSPEAQRADMSDEEFATALYAAYAPSHLSESGVKGWVLRIQKHGRGKAARMFAAQIDAS